jgi:hypothetical protein
MRQRVLAEQYQFVMQANTDQTAVMSTCAYYRNVIESRGEQLSPACQSLSLALPLNPVGAPKREMPDLVLASTTAR